MEFFGLPILTSVVFLFLAMVVFYYFCCRSRRNSLNNQQNMTQMEEEDATVVERNFLRNCGGDLTTSESSKSKKLSVIKEEKGKENSERFTQDRVATFNSFHYAGFML